MNVYVFLGLLLLAYAFALLSYLFRLHLKSRGANSGGIALGQSWQAVFFCLWVLVGMGAAVRRTLLGLRTKNSSSSAREVTGLRGHAPK